VKKAKRTVNPAAAVRQFSFIPANDEQREVAQTIRDNDITLIHGRWGTAKTHCALGTAAELVIQGKYKKVVIVRPLVEAGEVVGFLKGDLGQKLDPWLAPFRDCLERLTFQDPAEFLEDFCEVSPLAFMRGRTFSRCVAILDEAQNAKLDQLKMFVTRLGHKSKMILVGDDAQTDLPGRSRYEDLVACLDGAEAAGADGEKYSVASYRMTVQCRHPLLDAVSDRLAALR
jgi:phosphate starvation-inducible protein PhoH